jgi:hypothetical protein
MDDQILDRVLDHVVDESFRRHKIEANPAALNEVDAIRDEIRARMTQWIKSHERVSTTQRDENLPVPILPALSLSPYGPGKREVRADWIGNPRWEILSRSGARIILSTLGIDIPDWLLGCHDYGPGIKIDYEIPF